MACALNLLAEFKTVVKGFADSRVILTDLLPEREKSNNKKSYGLKFLAEDYLPNEDLSLLHDALTDTRVLKKVLKKVDVDDKTVKLKAKLTEVFFTQNCAKNKSKLTKVK